MITQPSYPRLSLVIGGRNDRHLGNFKWRFENTLNYLGTNLKAMSRLNDVEVVIADWGSETPLHAVLSLNLQTQKIVRFIIIPPDLAQSLQGDSQFPIVLAQNTAIRRCRGEYIAQTDSDILFTKQFLERLFGILDGRKAIDLPLDQSLFVSKRRMIPQSFVIRCPDLQQVDSFTRHFGRLLPKEPMFPVKGLDLYTATGFVMMHRALWESSGGYDERLVHYGWMDVDLALRISSRYPWKFMDTLGVPPVFHLEHRRPWSRHPGRPYNPMRYDNVFHPNGDGWGLQRYSLVEFVYPPVEHNRADVITDFRGLRVSYNLLLDIMHFVVGNIWQLSEHAYNKFPHQRLRKRLSYYYSRCKTRALSWQAKLKRQILTA